MSEVGRPSEKRTLKKTEWSRHCHGILRFHCICFFNSNTTLSLKRVMLIGKDSILLDSEARAEWSVKSNIKDFKWSEVVIKFGLLCKDFCRSTFSSLNLRKWLSVGVIMYFLEVTALGLQQSWSLSLSTLKTTTEATSKREAEDEVCLARSIRRKGYSFYLKSCWWLLSNRKGFQTELTIDLPHLNIRGWTKSLRALEKTH